jgi:hypothetical protein
MTVRRFLTTLAAIAAMGTPLVGGPAPVGAAVPDELVSIARGNHSLSPDGDGRRDSTRITFDLEKRARVSIEVFQRGVAAFAEPLRLGPLDAGRHYWKFEGRDDRGRQLPDDEYVVTLTARLGDRESVDIAAGWITTTEDHGTLLVSRPTVYPKATVVEDHLLVQYLREGWNPTDAAFPGDGGASDPMPIRVHLFIQDRQGRRVFRDTVRNDWTSTFDWDGKRRGKPVHAGKYTARVVVADAAGNRASYRETLWVSHRQLAPEVWTATVPAAQALGYLPPSPPSCNGCGEGCGPVPSTRFTDGLSFPVCSLYSYDAATDRHFTMPVPFAAAPVDTYRVTAAGGPTVAGADDFGRLDGVIIGPGDASATTAFEPVSLSAVPYLTEQVRPVAWSFSTDGGNSYDVATFTVEYRRYVPVVS